MAKRVSQPKTASQSEESTQPKRVAQPKRAAQPKRPAQPKRAGQPKPKRPAQPRRATQPKRKRSTADNGGLPPRRSRRLNPQLFLPHSLHTIPWEISELIYGYLDQDDLDNLRLSSRAIYDRLELNGYRDLTISISDWNHRKIKIVLNDPRWLANINSIKLNSLILAAPPDIDVNRLIRVAAGLTSDADLDANTVQNPLITQQRIIYFAQAVGEQRRILAHKAFFKDLSYLLQRCQNLERIEMRCVASVDAFEENMEQAFPDMIFDEIPLDNWIRIDEPFSTRVGGMLMNSLKVLRKNSSRLRGLEQLNVQGMPINAKIWGETVWGRKLHRHINGFSESLCELELNFEKNPQERLPMGSTSIWRLLDQSTRFPLLKKLTLNCVVLRGNRADENMDEFLQVHRGTLKEIHLQDWYFDSNPPQRDSWFTVLRSFAEKADLERFSPGRYIGFIRYQNQAPGHYSRDSLSRSLNFPEIETGIMRPIPRHMLYRYLICGDPDSPETSLASKLWWQGTDWSEFNFDKLKQVEDEARGLAEASTRQDRS